MDRKQFKIEVCKGKDLSLMILSRCYGLAVTVKQKWKNKIYMLQKVDDRISFLQLNPSAKIKTKTKPKHKLRKMVLNQELGSTRLD